MTEPLIPGSHVENWQKIRKKQWTFAKATLKDNLACHSSLVRDIKEYYVEGFEEDPEDMFEFYPTPTLAFWLAADQSEQSWQAIWQEYKEEHASGFVFSDDVKQFLDAAHLGEEGVASLEQTYGAFGGLEQRMLAYFVPTTIYTDETQLLGGREYRLVPWETPHRTFQTLLSRSSKYFDWQWNQGDEKIPYPISPFSPYQYMHEMLISTFSYDLQKDNKYSEKGNYVMLSNLKNVLADNAADYYHPNHIVSGLKMVDILEDKSTTPSYLRDIWLKVKNDKQIHWGFT